MSIPGTSLVLDPNTGYMVGTTTRKFVGFTAEKKVRVMQLLKKCWPDITAACDAVGVSTTAFYDHLHLDPKMAGMVEEFKKRETSKLERVMVERAQTPGGFMDRIARLRYLAPLRYNPVAQQQVADKKKADNMMDLMKVVDAKNITEDVKEASSG